MKRPPFWWFVVRRILLIISAPIWIIPFGVACMMYALYKDWRREYNEEPPDSLWLKSQIEKVSFSDPNRGPKKV